uniref:Uncharacterized protein n=1 Tax=Rhodosorus marinus TaxID=101924 RepID=A0A7S3EH50_9RHOD|mmetsp:Transcript_35639/g.142331  ORF Transcript_35639/g.142331 Transcript_35639/m.142331 type:complete len:117 (+) Transcript_35639:1565-1915(+)
MKLVFRFEPQQKISDYSGLDNLVAEIGLVLTELMTDVEVIVPYDRGDIMNEIYTQGAIEYEQYLAEGTYIAAAVPTALSKKLKSIRVDLEAEELEELSEADMWKQLAKKRHATTNP